MRRKKLIGTTGTTGTRIRQLLSNRLSVSKLHKNKQEQQEAQYQ